MGLAITLTRWLPRRLRAWRRPWAPDSISAAVSGFGAGFGAISGFGALDAEIAQAMQPEQPRSTAPAIGWRRAVLVVVALSGCVLAFLLARHMAGMPTLAVDWRTGPNGELVLVAGPDASLAAPQGRTLAAIEAPGRAPLAVDATLVQRSARWQVDDERRDKQLAQQLGLDERLAAGGKVTLQFRDGPPIVIPVLARGFAGLGLMFWPLVALALLLMLLGAVLPLARADRRNVGFFVMCQAQAVNLAFVAVQSVDGLGGTGLVPLWEAPLRAGLDLITAAGALHVLALGSSMTSAGASTGAEVAAATARALVSFRLRAGAGGAGGGGGADGAHDESAAGGEGRAAGERASGFRGAERNEPIDSAAAAFTDAPWNPAQSSVWPWVWALLGWAVALGFAPLFHFGDRADLWWWAQGLSAALLAAACWVATRNYRQTPDPYVLLIRRFVAVALVVWLLVTGTIAATSDIPGTASGTAGVASAMWTLFAGSLLLLSPFVSRSRKLLRELALLAGISTVATSLDLLFAALFALGPFTSLTLAVFLALGVYAGVRQWLLNQMMASQVLTTERTFEQIYRLARDVQANPARYPARAAQLLRELFDPLEVMPLAREIKDARVLGNGTALVVPIIGADEGADALPAAAVLRFARRGRRLFSHDDARLAERVIDQLKRAVEYDRAVERGRAEERQRIAQDLHDDIGARLLTLMYKAQSPEMEDYIRHTLKDLKTLSRGLAAGETRLTHAAAEWKADLAQRAAAAHVELEWHFDADRDPRLSVVPWSALTRVLRELVSNALAHAGASRIEVRLRLQSARLTLRVADNGRGRAPQEWAHGLGLGGVRKRVKQLGGTVSWRENGPAGIVCEVIVPGFAEGGPALPASKNTMPVPETGT
jgi:signal transduction histidine kinase